MTQDGNFEKNGGFQGKTPSYISTLYEERAIRKRFSLEEGDFLSTEDVARVLSVRDEVVRDIIRRRELPAIKIGKAYRICKDDLQRFLNARYTPHMDTTPQEGHEDT
jgi:excisionase family DNA binding protein